MLVKMVWIVFLMERFYLSGVIIFDDYNVQYEDLYFGIYDLYFGIYETIFCGVKILIILKVPSCLVRLMFCLCWNATRGSSLSENLIFLHELC